jgi:GrpB-like predicted nucleotidyltransferase (UPF0157 family)
MRVRVVAPDASWPQEFQRESADIARMLGGLVSAVHHIGSTSVPGIFAKPIIDILLEVSEISALDSASAQMQQLGYESLGEYGIERRRYFRKRKSEASGVRTHHVHAFRHGDPHVRRHLAFRNYLIAHPDVAAAYSTLKQELARRYPDDIEAYMDGKNPFITTHEARALAWSA